MSVDVTEHGFTVNLDVLFHAPAGAEEEAHEEVPEDDLNPIFPELKEITWGFGAFIVLAVLMRGCSTRACTRASRHATS